MGTLCGASATAAAAAPGPGAQSADEASADCKNSRAGIAACLTVNKLFLTLFHPCCRLDRHYGKIVIGNYTAGCARSSGNKAAIFSPIPFLELRNTAKSGIIRLA
jgi:hypothetical protein